MNAQAELHPHLTIEGDTFQVRDGYTPDEHSRRCRTCDASICWVGTPAGKRMPVDPDGRSHFATCPDAASWRNPRNPTP